MRNSNKRKQTQDLVCGLPGGRILGSRLSFLLTVMMCLVFSIQAQAQRCLPGMRGIQLTAGMVDGIYSSGNKNETGYYVGAAMATYAKNANKWLFGAEFLNKYDPYKKERIPISQFTAEGGYYLKILSDHNKTLLFSLGASALAGYETSNWGEKTLYDGATLQNKDAFVYGGAITLEVETYLTDRMVLLFTAHERMLQGTTTGHFHTQFGLGIKYIIN